MDCESELTKEVVHDSIWVCLSCVNRCINRVETPDLKYLLNEAKKILTDVYVRTDVVPF